MTKNQRNILLIYCVVVLIFVTNVPWTANNIIKGNNKNQEIITGYNIIWFPPAGSSGIDVKIIGTEIVGSSIIAGVLYFINRKEQ